MADYTTADLVKGRLDIEDTIDDAIITSVVTAASRVIDEMCGRSFQAVTETRYFSAGCSYEVDIDDLTTLTTLQTDSDGDRTYEDTWATTDYDLEPYNAAAKSWPYTKLTITPIGQYAFPTVRKGIKITGVWGWPTVPSAVEEAATLLAIRWFKRKDAPFGIAGVNELGQVQMMGSSDPDVKAMLASYRKFTVGAF